VFGPGLNTVLGDQIGSNSIGKTTFLMIIDFVFGGNDYIDKSTDVQNQVGQHIINFTFKFDNQNYYFSRNTFTHNRVNECDVNYHTLSEMPIEDFRDFLLNKYKITLPLISFRDIVTRYFRVYGRDNLNEKHPLQSVQKEPEENAVVSLMKLFNVYENVASLRKELEETKKNQNTIKNQ
jgi:predicted ATP-dependent endonuclease of OLD family